MGFLSKIKKAVKGSLNPVKQVKAIAKGDKDLLWNPIKQTKAILDDPSSLLTPHALGPAGAAAQSKVERDAKAAKAAAAGGGGGPSGGLANPWAMFSQMPGIGYGPGPGGNPFEGVAAQIPSSFFQNPQAQAALTQMLGGGSGPAPAPAAPMSTAAAPMAIPPMSNPFEAYLQQLLAGGATGGTPGPAPSQDTMMGRVGGFGNGGGKMTIPGAGHMMMSPRIKGRVMGIR